MRSRHEIKEIASQLFAAQRGTCILVLLVVMLLSSAVSSLAFIPLIGTVAVIALAIVFEAGAEGSFLKGVRGERMEVEDVFSAFSGGRFGRTLGGGAFRYLKILLWMLPGLALYIGGFIYLFVFALGTGATFFMDPDSFSGLEGVGSALNITAAILIMSAGYILMLVFGLIKQYAYIFTLQILMENPYVSPTYAVKLSEKMTSGHKGDLFVMQLSFIGWILLGTLTLGILNIVYVQPRMAMTLAAYYYEIKQEALASGRVRIEEFQGAQYV